MDFTQSSFDGKYENYLSNQAVTEILAENKSAVTGVRKELIKQLQLFDDLPVCLTDGCRLSLIGGSIRDIINNKDIKDIDILVSVRAKQKINEEHITLFRDLPQEKKDAFIKNFRDSLVQSHNIFTNQPLEEKDMWKYIIKDYNPSVYAFSEDGDWDLDKMFQSIEDENTLREKYEPEKLIAGIKVEKKLNSPDYDTNALSLYSFVLSQYLEKSLAQENDVSSFLNTEEFDRSNAVLSIEKEYLNSLNTEIPNNQGIERYMNLSEKKEELQRALLDYGVIKGILSVVKAQHKNGGFNKDFILSFADDSNFVETFDFNILESFAELKSESLNSDDSFLRSIKFSNNAKSGYINKELVYKFFQDDDFNKRLPRYKERIEKNLNKFPDFNFSSVYVASSKENPVVIHKKNEDGSYVSYSKEELNKRKVNIDTYSLLISFSFNIILNNNKINVAEKDDSCDNDFKI